MARPVRKTFHYIIIHQCAICKTEYSPHIYLKLGIVKLRKILVFQYHTRETKIITSMSIFNIKK